MSASVTLPRMMEIGGGAIARTPDLVKNLNASRVLLITDKTMVQFGYADKVQQLLTAADIESSVYADTIPEPTASSVDEAVQIAKDGGFDCLIALGGGSAIDSAKARVQVRSNGKFCTSQGMRDMIVELACERALYRGLSTVLARAIPIHALYLPTFDYLLQFFEGVER